MATNPYPNAIQPSALVGGQTIIHRVSGMKMVYRNPGFDDAHIQAAYFNTVTGTFITDTFCSVEFDNEAASS